MKVKKIVAEDFVHYKKPSMVIACYKCNWKCCMDAGYPASMCQNEPIAQMENINVSFKEIYDMYKNNPLTEAIVFAGLEPMEQVGDLWGFITYIRKMGCNDDVVIYTGYNKDEVIDEVAMLGESSNIIVKYGRFIPGQDGHIDEVLGVKLASNNQYAERIGGVLK